jgi:hypothetical protein
LGGQAAGPVIRDGAVPERDQGWQLRYVQGCCELAFGVNVDLAEQDVWVADGAPERSRREGDG